MCGFVGVLDNMGTKEYDIEKMLKVIYHRGPDQQRTVSIGDNIKLGFARLAIIDLEGGSQPMASEDGNIIIMLNGEVYNYIELRKKLEKDGIKFYTTSDTEVVLKCYIKYGMDMLPLLEGMYGIVIVDKTINKMFLIRDRIGIKPLYYAQKKNTCAFASEIKPLLKVPFVSKEISKASVAEFLEYEYIHAPNTIFQDVKKVLPGCYLEVGKDGINEKEYWDCNEIKENTTITVEDAKKKVVNYLKESLKLHLRSDVQLGCFLSGGIDSGLLVALASEQVNNLDTYTLKFENGDFDETELAQKVAERYHTNHHCYTVKADEFKRLLPEIMWYFDEPIGDSGILPNYILNELVRKDGTKVILSGAGGDELFGGYAYYFENDKERIINHFPKISRRVGKILKNRRPNLAQKIDRSLMYKENPLKHMIACERTLTQEEIESILGIKSNGSDTKLYYGNKCKQEGLNKLLYTDIKTYLVDDLMLLSDRSCMAFSVEGRVPFLYKPLIEYTMQIPPSIKAHGNCRKWLLKEIAKDFLPEELLNAPKMGFCSPIQRWANNGLAEYAYNILNSERAKTRKVWDKNGYEAYVKDMTRYKTHFEKIYLLLCLELFFRIHVDNSFESKREIDLSKIYDL